MDYLHAIIANGLAERYTYLADRVRELAAPLSEEQLWQKPFPFGNSFGHLVLHLTGNLNYYIGAEVAGTGYVRDRLIPLSAKMMQATDSTFSCVAQPIFTIMWGRWCICVLRWAEVPNRISGNRLRKNPRKQIPRR